MWMSIRVPMNGPGSPETDDFSPSGDPIKEAHQYLIGSLFIQLARSRAPPSMS